MADVTQEDYDRKVQELENAKSLITRVFFMIHKLPGIQPVLDEIAKSTGSWLAVVEGTGEAVRRDESEPAHEMDPKNLRIGDTIEDSPVGPGFITGITEAGYPQVNETTVAVLKRTDGVVYERYGLGYKAWKEGHTNGLPIGAA